MRLILAILCAGLAQATWAETLTGRVVAIADGDTLTLLDVANRQHHIRLMGIDAPEKAQQFGNRSRTALGARAFGKDAVAECGKRDRYGREVCKIIVDSVDINLEQIRAGMAWWYRQYAKEQTPGDREEYELAEFQAKSHRQGLWADKNPVPPWEWRHDPLKRTR